MRLLGNCPKPLDRSMHELRVFAKRFIPNCHFFGKMQNVEFLLLRPILIGKDLIYDAF